MRCLTVCTLLAAIAVCLPVSSRATPSQPSYGMAVVDGQCAEWNLATDFFANMYRAGNPAKPLESKIYLRYGCPTHTMYILVLTEPGVVGYREPGGASATSWVAIDLHSRKVVNEYSGNDGVPPDFTWVGQAYDGDPSHVKGYEASFSILPGTYMILAHIGTWDVEGQTSATTGFPKMGPEILILCLPQATELGTWGAIKALFK